jgi:DNA polymerase-3 subunit delta
MDLDKFKKSIMQGKLKPVYLFYGEADLLKEEALNWYQEYLATKNAGNLALEIINEEIGLGELIDSANTIPLFYPTKLIIVKDATYFAAKKTEGDKKESRVDDKAFLAYLENPNPGSFIILLAQGKPDSRKKIFQALAKAEMVVEFDLLKGRELLEWVRKGFSKHHKKISARALDYLVTCVGTDLALLSQEISKLILYAGEKQEEITFDSVKELVSQTPQVTIFNLVDAVAEGRGVAATLHCEELLKQGEKEFMIAYMLARQFRLILETKLLTAKGYTQGQLPQILQAKSFVISKALKQGRKFSIEKLAQIMSKLLDLDVAIKTGKGNPKLLLETTIADLCF